MAERIKILLHKWLFIIYVRLNGEGWGLKNPENCLTLVSKVPYEGGGRGVKKSQKLPYIINEQPLKEAYLDEQKFNTI